MSSMACVVARPFIVASVLDGEPLSERVAGHRDSCLRCQATEARVRATGRSLKAMDQPVTVPVGLTARVVDGLDQPLVEESPPAVGRALGIAALAAVVVVVARRNRSR